MPDYRSAEQVLSLLAVLTLATPAAGQVQEPIDVPTTIKCFEESVFSCMANYECPEGVVAVGEVLFQTSRFDSTSATAVADGLKHLALYADSLNVQTTAVARLAQFGRPLGSREEPVPGTVARLAEIYERTERPAIRELAITKMYGQGETEAARAFLMDVARSDRPSQWFHLPDQYAALATLARMDPDRGAALRRLYVEGRVSDTRARSYLDRLAEADFRSPSYQMEEGYGEARVTGSIRDSLTGAPLPQAYFCAGTPAFRNTNRQSSTCALTDNQGQFTVDSLPAGRYVARWACFGRHWIGSARYLGVDTLVYEDCRTTKLDLRVDAEGCDRRPREFRYGRFEGYYASEYEMSKFMSLDEPNLDVWVEFGDVDWSEWPNDRGYAHSCVRVDWLGELEGPGYYGHANGADYQLTVDSLASITRVDWSECESRFVW